MQKKYRLISVFLFIIMGLPVMAEQSPEEILNAIVKVKATIPQDASTARILGTEREGNGVVIDDNGNILTIGYLILEAETIEVIDAQGNPVKARSAQRRRPDFDDRLRRVQSGFRLTDCIPQRVCRLLGVSA